MTESLHVHVSEVGLRGVCGEIGNPTKREIMTWAKIKSQMLNLLSHPGDSDVGNFFKLEMEYYHYPRALDVEYQM